MKSVDKSKLITSRLDGFNHGKIISDTDGILVCHFQLLNSLLRNKILRLLNMGEPDYYGNHAKFKYNNAYKSSYKKRRILAKLGKTISEEETPVKTQVLTINHKNSVRHNCFCEIQKQAILFKSILIQNKRKLFSLLSQYETYNVIEDEYRRCIEFINNINKNKKYFDSRGGRVAVFLPLNQPLYALFCYVVVPSMQTDIVYVRPPSLMRDLFANLVEIMQLDSFYPNIYTRLDGRNEFISFITGKVDIVIFTGKYTNGQSVYKQVKPNLFIFNGAGHNPVIVEKNADIKKAVDSVIRLTTYNQGQDCAAPNSILVHDSVETKFVKMLNQKLNDICLHVGPGCDKSNLVGPNTDKKHVVEIAKVLSDLNKYIVRGGEINIKHNLIYPTILRIPVVIKQMYYEFFSPIIVIQPYKNEKELELYFDNTNYKRNAMYLTVFGKSKIVNKLIRKGIHTWGNVLQNTDLHVGEKGYLEYGGSGPEASFYILNGQKNNVATLPQREISLYHKLNR